MTEPNRVWGLSPGAWALAGCLALLLGLAAVIAGVATGSALLLAVGCAAVFGAGLLPSYLDLRSTQAALEAIRRRNQERAATVKPALAIDGPIILREGPAGQWGWIEPDQPRLH